MHQINPIDRDEHSNEIKGKASVTYIRRHCRFPFPSSGTELAVAATGCSLYTGSSCFYSSCQSDTSWVFGRAWAGAGHLRLNRDNCACRLSRNKGKHVGGEWESRVNGQLWENSSSGMKICQCSSWPQWVQSNMGHRRYPACHLYRKWQSHYRCFLFSTFAFFWWIYNLLGFFNADIQIV